LRLLREFSTDLPHKIDFVSRTKAVIFVGDRTQGVGEAAIAELERYNPEEYIAITRKQ
jgi:hypothetical protein